MRVPRTGGTASPFAFGILEGMSSPAKSWALVTGASSGIGAEFARLLAAQGYPLLLSARRADRLEALAEELRASHQTEVRLLVADLSVPGAAEALWAEVEQLGLPISVLVNNAGFGDHGPFAESEWERMQAMIQLNITALTALTRFALPAMRSRRQGHILNVASVAAFQPGPGMAVYFATKAYVLSFTEALWSELQGTGVVATTLCPGPTESEFFDAARMGDKSMARRKLPTSREVAALGLRALFAGKRTVIHGVGNWILAASNRLAPRGAVLAITRKILQ